MNENVNSSTLINQVYNPNGIVIYHIFAVIVIDGRPLNIFTIKNDFFIKLYVLFDFLTLL